MRKGIAFSIIVIVEDDYFLNFNLEPFFKKKGRKGFRFHRETQATEATCNGNSLDRPVDAAERSRSQRG